ncbi:hypothetical protein FQN60_012563 [Etheostoma spectabile]|uniref:NID domain-containing protein n=1 Tax=Etheostoma spectabile TaxID=54343 RepID=A0A5J5CDL9_9PERO|nr:hypothetical protein FQN60_012563 [Etheostoma spectabile]
MTDLCDSPMNGQADGLKEDASGLEEARKELETWKAKAERADDVKARLILEKLEEDEAKVKAQQEMLAYVKQQEECQKDFNESMNAVQDQIRQLARRRKDLLDKLKSCQAQLEVRRVESTKLKQKFKIYAQIPDTEVKFSAPVEEEVDGDSQPIRGVFAISQKAGVLLHGGQALITFEEEKVASQVLKIAKCSVSCEDTTVDVHLDVSRKELKLSNIPPSMPEERVADRLEVSFSRPSRGGGEVEKTFCGAPKRTILLDDIEDKEDEEDLQDHLEIHFQKPSNYGGEIESIKYISRGKKALHALFSEDRL